MNTTPTPDNLESQLRELTAHRGPETNLWQKALNHAAAAPAPTPATAFPTLSRTIPQPVLVGLAATILLVISVSMLVPSLGKARGGRPTLASSPRSVESWTDAERSPSGSTPAPATTGTGGDPVTTGFASPDTKTFFGRSIDQSGQPELRDRTDLASRHVIQKSTIELQTPDVRAVFAKCSHLLASGEFVENSSLTGDGKTAQANLTLRIAATRLSEVLNQLRTLGIVKSENTTGEDVTSQVVDLEARIRNEQRIEKELLELLDKRADAPLKDILELRNSLSTVRQSIEQYIAQRDRLGRLVSLASILVVIRAEPEPAPEPKPAQSITAYFVKSISQTWQDGLRAASDSITWLIRILISGAMWWLLLAAILYSIHRYRRRLAARCV